MPQLFSDAGGDRTVIVGADTQFNGRAYNRQKEHVEHVRFLWNFGDGSTADGPAVVHHYTYPGRYAVMLTIAQNLDAVSDRIVVTAEPAKLAFDVPSDGSVAIENHAGRDLDLSGWIVRSTGQLFTLPEGSVILSNETMRIPQKTLKFWSGTQTELDYPNGVVVLRANESSGMVVPAPVSAPSPSPVPSVAPVARAQAAPSGKPAQETFLRKLLPTPRRLHRRGKPRPRLLQFRQTACTGGWAHSRSLHLREGLCLSSAASRRASGISLRKHKKRGSLPLCL